MNLESGTTSSGDTTVSCPACGVPFVVGVERCGACELRLIGPEAVELWSVDQELTRLQNRRQLLLGALRPGAEPLAAPSIDVYAAPARLSGAHAGPRPYPLPAATSSSPQRLLLTLGVGLLFVAAVVFVAVAWQSVGLVGQFVLIIVSVAASSWAAVLCESRRLHTSAEAFAVLSCGVAVVGIVGAYRLDVLGLGDISAWTYTGVTMVLLALLTVGAQRWAASLGAYRWATLAAAWVAAVALGGGWSEPALATGLVAAWVVVSSPLLARTRAGFTGGDLQPWSLTEPFALASGVLGVLLGSYVLAADAFSGLELARAAVAVFVFVLGVGWAYSAHRPFASLSGETVGRAGFVWVLAGAEVSAALRNAPAPALLVGVVVALAGVAAMLVFRSPRTQAWSPQLGRAFVGGGVAAALLTLVDGTQGASALALALLATGAAAVALADPAWRVRGLLVAALSSLVAVGFFLADLDAEATRAAVVYAVCAGILAALAFASLRAPAIEQNVLAGSALLALAVSLWLTVPDASAGWFVDGPVSDRLVEPWLVATVVLGIAAVVTLAYSALRSRRRGTVLAALFGTAAVWIPLLQSDVRQIEAFTLSAAAICGLLGVAVHVRAEAPRSWETLGPSVALALLPSAVLVNETGSVWRLVFVIVASTAALLFGVAARLRAFVTLGAAALAIAMALQLALVAVGLPRWVTFGVAGLILVAVGVRYERNVRDLRAVGAWFDRMD